MTISISKVAIIGAGAGGLVTLNEFLHTSKSGRSTITKDQERHELPEEPAFEEVVVFEQNDTIGGVWNYTETADEGFPETVKEYYSPLGIRPPRSPPTDLENTSNAKPVEVKAKKTYQWNTSGVYENLYTNVPIETMRFSSGAHVKSGIGCNVNPFVMHHHVLDYLKEFAETNDLKKYIRFRSSIEQMYKEEKTGKWVLTVVQTVDGVERWYQEKFDAVVVAVGKFNIPFFAEIDGLPNYAIKHKNVKHAKSYRKSKDYKDKRILIVGAHVSAIDMLQYLVSQCKEIHVSLNSPSIEEFNPTNDPAKAWIWSVLTDPAFGVHVHPKIHHFADDHIEFFDGEKDNFDEVILATGYHTYYPFLNVPQNEGKEYVKISPVSDKDPHTQQSIVNNLYLYTFAIGDPTVCHIGLPRTPLFFLLSEVSAIAIAGVWSKAKSLPSQEQQRQWVKDFETAKIAGAPVILGDQSLELYNTIHSLGPKDRYNFFDHHSNVDFLAIKQLQKSFFYKVIRGEIKLPAAAE
ncbi:hypothetical protein OGAPHI_001706 [Ogataea philodendri]|uniref:Flavin-containing monooxygenase n=1 Tax=Ogataea philodendri TaxID=1378263 RepID=A0A9P8P9N0_9ASCO|nr:uncharacterized protein OGAPHI_001706 [Ogataea philodendri]KAH3667952.1 hypothetical protein OGAPHI_001706 [Ogataea philodendri]